MSATALVINCGSSSLRAQRIDPDNPAARVAVYVERIGAGRSVATVTEPGSERRRHSLSARNHQDALAFVLGHLGTGTDDGIAAVGHRVVHGGERFVDSVRIDDDVIAAIADAFDLAPLHNPANLEGIRAARALFPDLPQVAVFDTAFHQTLPEHAFLYGIPMRLYRRHGFRRYGFHGISHDYVSRRLHALSGIPPDGSRVISCHLGNGCSVTAIRAGRSIDTSMGMTPLAGLIMGTRAGDIDPSIVFDLVDKEELALHEVHTLLNRHSGLLGLSGYSSDVRDLIAEADAGDTQCRLALDVFCYCVRSYIGRYMAVLNGCDAIIFTAGIGENSPLLRERICAGLDGLGVHLEPLANAAAIGVERCISVPDSRLQLWAIPTDEEQIIALDALRVARNNAL